MKFFSHFIHAAIRPATAALLLLLASCAGGGSSPPADEPWWVPEEPRHSDRLVLTDPAISDPLQWWAVNIHAPVPDRLYQSEARAVLAQEMVDVTNSTRALYGLPPVERLGGLDRVAQAHARDQGIRDYWSHSTPEGLSSRKRIAAAGLGTVSIGGENSSIYSPRDWPASRIIGGWENHVGHRELLLDPNVKYIGIGIYHYPGDEFEHYVQLLVDFAPAE